MAELYRRGEDRESWIAWAIAFMERGLWLCDYVTVHGPHGPNAAYLWGEAEARDDRGYGYETKFCTIGTCRNMHDLRGLRISCENETHPKVSYLSPKAQRWLKAAKAAKKQLAIKRSINFA